MTIRSLARACTVAVVFLLATAPLQAQPKWKFSKIADTSTPIPFGQGNFFSFDNHPAIDAAGNVAFAGRGRAIGQPPRPLAGVYRNTTSNITRIADTLTLVPGSSEPFNFNAGYLSLGISEFSVAFAGFSGSSIPISEGIYDGKGGSLRVIADRSTLIPTTISTFTEFNSLHLGRRGSTMAFIGGNSVIQGVYAGEGGPLTIVADSNTVTPGGDGGTFAYFFTVGYDGDSVAFSGSESDVRVGVFRYTWGTLSLIANHRTPVPGGVGTFEYAIGSTIDQGVVAFYGVQGESKGIYVGDGNTVSLVADFKTPIPGGVGTFTEFGKYLSDYPSIWNGAVSFIGAGADFQLGIYSTLGGTLHKVIDLNDLLDGRRLRSFNMKNQGFNNNRIAFRAEFTDGSTGIFVATLGS